MSILQSILDGITAVVANLYFAAIFLGLVISLAGTQWIKFNLPVPHRWLVRAVGLPLGMIPTWLIWPDQFGWAWGLAVGFGAPWVYKGAVALISMKWPEFAARLSAVRADEKEPNESDV